MPAHVTSGDRWLARSHALLGVVLLGGFLIYHLVQLWPVLDSREAWAMAAAQRGGSQQLAIGVLVVLLAHGVLGALRIARSRGAQLTRDERGLRTIQAVSGVLIAAFVVYHLAHLWGTAAEPHGSVRASYDVLWSSLGKPLQMSVYLLGVSLTCFHFAHGVSRVALGFGAQPPSAARRLLLRVLAGAFGFGLWALWLQVLAHFVIGQRLF
jgi:succinate dehydrogenase / fumarate reductase cytochrome b subunit